MWNERFLVAPPHPLAAGDPRFVLELLEVAKQRARLGQQTPAGCGERPAPRVIR